MSTKTSSPSAQLETRSPINRESIQGQLRRLREHLLNGATINHRQATEMGITYLNSRISDLKNDNGMEIHSRYIRIEGITCKEYSHSPFKVQK